MPESRITNPASSVLINFTKIMENQRPRRAPALERLIAEIGKDDIRVKVFGKISDLKDGLLILEDETGKIKVDTTEKAEKGKKVLVIGRPIEASGGLELQAEIIKDAQTLNENLYKKAHLLISKGGHK